jgi:acylphosphatase
VTENAAFLATVYGRVQGVNFRLFVMRCAREMELKGYVRNLLDGGSLEVYVEGDKERLDDFLGHIHSGPSQARVDWVDVKWSEYSGDFKSFEVRR